MRHNLYIKPDDWESIILAAKTQGRTVSNYLVSLHQNILEAEMNIKVESAAKELGNNRDNRKLKVFLLDESDSLDDKAFIETVVDEASFCPDPLNFESPPGKKKDKVIVHSNPVEGKPFLPHSKEQQTRKKAKQCKQPKSS